MRNLIKKLTGFANKIQNGSLVYDAVYVEKMRKIITKINKSNELLKKPQTKWEFSKYEIPKIANDYSKTTAKKRKKTEY